MCKLLEATGSTKRSKYGCDSNIKGPSSLSFERQTSIS